MSEPFIGEIRMVPWNWAPYGWVLCDGRELQVSQNQALFSLISNKYGGNGTTTFKVPDLRGRVPINQGQGAGSAYVIAQSGGSEVVTLNATQMPAHAHAFSSGGNSGIGDQASPINNYPAKIVDADGTLTINGYSATTNGKMKAETTEAAGGNAAHSNMQPYLCVNFIIATEGIYPSRP